MACPVIDPDFGSSLEYRHLSKVPTKPSGSTLSQMIFGVWHKELAQGYLQEIAHFSSFTLTKSQHIRKSLMAVLLWIFGPYKSKKFASELLLVVIN